MSAFDSHVYLFQGTLTDLEKDVKNMNESDAQLKRNFLDLKEWDAVLDKTDEFFQGVRHFSRQRLSKIGVLRELTIRQTKS